jgi:nucleotide-binding universal stress UspA family protein
MKKIVVGTDGSEHATVAMRWALDEAAVHGAELEVVLVWSLFDQHHPDRSDKFEPGYSEASARTTLAAWVSEALGEDARVSQRVITDFAARGLLEAGDAADLLVVGARGKGGFQGLLVGSVSDKVAQMARRPVAVVREQAPVAGGRVVVGVDGSARSLDALRWAADEARARSAELEVVHAWNLPMMSAPPVVSLFSDMGTLEEAGRATLDLALADPALKGVNTRSHLVAGGAAQALLGRAAGATLLVAGTRGLGRVAGALLGSVSRQLVNHAPCPVVLI